jgi:hypothetical protein
LFRDWASALGDTAGKREKERTAAAAADFWMNSLRLQVLFFMLTEISFVEAPRLQLRAAERIEETTSRL